MRPVFSIVGLLLVLAVVGVLVKKQLGAGVVPRAASSSEVSTPAAVPPAQEVQQFRQAVDNAMQQPRPMPDDAK